jgi:hypothetical protein
MTYIPETRHWYTHPAIGIAELAVGILGIALASYFYLASQRVRQLDFYVSPDRAIVVKSGLSDLHVLYQNQEIKEDVTAAQFTIWNAGNEPITMDNVLSPVEIVTSPKTKILSASVRRVSRDVIALQTDQKLLPTGVVPLSWKILEHGDGGVVQVIYLGGPDVKLNMAGTIEGQSQIRRVHQLVAKVNSPAEQLKIVERVIEFSAGLVILISGVLVVLVVLGRKVLSQPLILLVLGIAAAGDIYVMRILYLLLSQPVLPFSS